jgi:predicted RecA/RadA family phage recombinase
MGYFDPKDVHIYDELLEVYPAVAVTKGQGVVEHDVFGFYIRSVTAADIADGREETAFIYRMRQVEAPKITGTGEDINQGERVYWIVAQEVVTSNPGGLGVAGVDYYFCGWAKRRAEANDATVLINFDGTRWDEDI